MKILTVLLSAGLAFAADPISIEDQERLSRAMLKLQAAQLDAQPYLIPMNAANKEVQTIVAEYQAKYKAAGCQLDPVTKAWQCPTPKSEPKK